jgi:hypothetical protein
VTELDVTATQRTLRMLLLTVMVLAVVLGAVHCSSEPVVDERDRGAWRLRCR